MSSISVQLRDAGHWGKGETDGVWLDLPLPPWSIEPLLREGRARPEGACVTDYRVPFGRSDGCWDDALPVGRRGWEAIQDVNALAAVIDSVGLDVMRDVDLCLAKRAYEVASPVEAASLVMESEWLPIAELESTEGGFYERLGHDLVGNGDEQLRRALSANPAAMDAFDFAAYGHRLADWFGIEQVDGCRYAEFDLAEDEELRHPREDVWERAFGREPGYYEHASRDEACLLVVEDMLRLGLPVSGFDARGAETADEVFRLGGEYIAELMEHEGDVTLGQAVKGLDEAIAAAEEYLGIAGRTGNPSLGETRRQVEERGTNDGEPGPKTRGSDPQR